MTFYAYELEGVCPAYGWQSGPSGNTEITKLKNQHEARNAIGDEARHYFTLPFANVESDDYLRYLKSVHMVMYAMTHSFLVKDWLDFEVEGEPIGDAPSGSTAVQLKKTYGIYSPGGSLLASRSRDITKPVAGAVVYQAGIAKAGTLDTATGLFTPSTAWTEGQALTWTGEFRVPVRFNNDYMPMSIENLSRGQHVVSGSVELIEVFGE